MLLMAGFRMLSDFQTKIIDCTCKYLPVDCDYMQLNMGTLEKRIHWAIAYKFYIILSFGHVVNQGARNRRVLVQNGCETFS